MIGTREIVQNCGFNTGSLCKWHLNLRSCMGNSITDVTLPCLIKFPALDLLITPVWSGNLWFLRSWLRRVAGTFCTLGLLSDKIRGLPRLETGFSLRGSSGSSYSVTRPGMHRSSTASLEQGVWTAAQWTRLNIWSRHETLDFCGWLIVIILAWHKPGMETKSLGPPGAAAPRVGWKSVGHGRLCVDSPFWNILGCSIKKQKSGTK